MDEDLKALLGYGAACVRVARCGKIPLGTAWNTLASSDPATIARWLADGDNIGLLCGSGNLIDIEYDDPAGRQTLAALGLLNIDTPTWASSRGEHRLFRLSEPLPPWGWKSSLGSRCGSAANRRRACCRPAPTPVGPRTAGW